MAVILQRIVVAGMHVLLLALAFWSAAVLRRFRMTLNARTFLTLAPRACAPAMAGLGVGCWTLGVLPSQIFSLRLAAIALKFTV